MTLRQALVALTLSFAAAPAFAQSVTYDFTGIVTGDYGSCNALCGQTVTGTYTFNYAVADDTVGTVGSPGFEELGVSGAAYAGDGFPVQSPFVFSSTATLGSILYSTAPEGTYSNYSAALGFPGQFEAQEYVNSTNLTSYFTLDSQTANPFSSQGLPLFSSSLTEANGGFDNPDLGVSITYNITSLTPVIAAVPEPSTWAAMLVGLGMLGFVGVRNRRSSSAGRPWFTDGLM
jgi:hypothetical protein